MGTHAIDVNDDTFAATVLESDKPVLVDFWGPRCGPCKMLAPVIEEIARDHGGELTVAKVNVEDNPAIARDLQIMAVPTMIVYSGGEAVQTIRGAKSKAFILRQLEPVLGSAE